jgi:hypothetical protein
MFNRLQLCNNDMLMRQAKPHWMDPVDPCLIVFDWDDVPKNAASFTRLPIAEEPIDSERAALVTGQRQSEGRNLGSRL